MYQSHIHIYNLHHLIDTRSILFLKCMNKPYNNVISSCLSRKINLKMAQNKARKILKNSTLPLNCFSLAVSI